MPGRGAQGAQGHHWGAHGVCAAEVQHPTQHLHQVHIGRWSMLRISSSTGPIVQLQYSVIRTLVDSQKLLQKVKVD